LLRLCGEGAFLSTSGEVFIGVNVENGNFTVGIWAEWMSALKFVSAGAWVGRHGGGFVVSGCGLP
tara:strand:+ start:550 stop:744 length:195 start_codon:yes stop_codon:yes gene_type:complete